MKTTHTPAPWKVCDEEQFHLIWSEKAKGYVASVDIYDSEGALRSNADADAALIAAAPELLQQLTKLLEQVQQLNYLGKTEIYLGDAVAAVDKATGEQE